MVADRVGEAESYLVDGESGYLTPAGDVAAMAARAAQVLGDPVLAARLSQAAQARYDALFDWPQLAARAETFYRQALAARSRS